MRAFDRWLGVPLCAIATWLARRDPRKPDGAPRQPLFIGLSETGSLVLASPALQAARAACGHSPWFLILAHNRSALELTGAIDPDRVFTLRADSLWHLLCDSIGFARRARRHGIDAAFDLEPFSRVSALLAWLSGAALRTGFAYPHRYRGQLFTHPLPATEIRHISLAFLDLVRIAWPAIPAPAPQRLPPPALPAIPASARWRDWLQQRNPAFEPASMRALFINANAGDLLPQRRWPEARYARLARALLDRHADLAIFLTGAPGETAAVAALARQIDHPRCCSIAGAISLADLPALFACGTLLISNDSGPAHFATLARLPVVVLFGPETPLRYRPLGPAEILYAALPCSPCITPQTGRASRCRDNRCLQAISVAQVLQAAQALLDRHRPPWPEARAA